MFSLAIPLLAGMQQSPLFIMILSPRLVQFSFGTLPIIRYRDMLHLSRSQNNCSTVHYSRSWYNALKENTVHKCSS